MQAASAADLYSSQGTFVSQDRGKTTLNMKYLTGELVHKLSVLHAVTATTWGQHPPTGPPQKMHLRTSEEQSVWRSMQSFTLAARTLLSAAIHTHPTTTSTLPPIAVQSASHGVGCTIDPAEMMVSKREAVSMSVLPSSTVEEPWDITKLSTLHHHWMGKWDFHWEMSWGEGNSSQRAMFPTKDVKWAKLPSAVSHCGQIRSF